MSSVAGQFGNHGQTDYGLARLAATLPLVDLVVSASVGPGEIALEHHADAELDTYLADHSRATWSSCPPW